MRIAGEKSKYSSYGDSWFTIGLADGTQAQLCAKCAGALKALQEKAPEPSEEAVTLLKSAESDLAAAAKLDPQSEHVRKNLRDVRDLLGKLGSAPAARTTRTAASAPAASSGSFDFWQFLGSVLTNYGWILIPALIWLCIRGCQ